MPKNRTIRFSVTPFQYTRQFYYALETGLVQSDRVSVDVTHKHSPDKDQAIICGSVDATTMSLGKYVLAKSISHTDVFPTDPLVVGAGLTYRQGSGLFAAADSKIKTATDLKGARVGIHDRSGAMTFHKAILDHHYGVNLDAIEWVVDTHQNLSGAFEAGKLDVVERVGDWYWAYLDDPGCNLIYDLADGWHELSGRYPLIHLIVMDGTVCEDEPTTVEAFLDVLRESRDYRDDNYTDVLTALKDESGGLEGEQNIDRLEWITETANVPIDFDEDAHANVRAWMEYAVEYDVLGKVIPDDRLFPEWGSK